MHDSYSVLKEIINKQRFDKEYLVYMALLLKEIILKNIWDQILINTRERKVLRKNSFMLRQSNVMQLI